MHKNVFLQILYVMHGILPLLLYNAQVRFLQLIQIKLIDMDAHKKLILLIFLFMMIGFVIQLQKPQLQVYNNYYIQIN